MGWTAVVQTTCDDGGMKDIFYFGTRPVAAKSRNETLSALFNLSCVKCGSVKLRFISSYDDDSGVTSLYLLCPRCNTRERMK